MSSTAIRRGAAAALLFLLVSTARGETPEALRLGLTQYAFDHTGSLSNLAPLCRACGSTAIFTGSIGALGYQGMPGTEALEAACREEREYLGDAAANGMRLRIGYVCATSIVHLTDFDRHWTPEFRGQFHTAPAQWLQLDRQGRVLPSWYSAPYEPACMNNPDWRRYEKNVVRLQLASGCNAIFFDNPTVHPQGCYCAFCMAKFAKALGARWTGDKSLVGMREWAASHPAAFREFRCGIAADFLAEMRRYARSIDRHALVTCNNSLNAPDALFSQCRSMGYDIQTTSAAEDFITIEDMQTQARRLADGRTIEYGPMYHVLHAIDHGKPIVATTLAEGDYHVAPHLARLGLAEAAANDAAWLLWPTWRPADASRMAAEVWPEADFLRRQERLLNGTTARSDVLVFLDFQRWRGTDRCAMAEAAAQLSQVNIQYAVCSEDNLAQAVKGAGAGWLLVESAALLNPAQKRAVASFQRGGGRVLALDEAGWLEQLRRSLDKPSIAVEGSTRVRAVVRDQPGRTIVHLYNLDIERLSSFEDRVRPSPPLAVTLRVPFRRVRKVHWLTADGGGEASLEFSAAREGNGLVLRFTCPPVNISSLLVAER
jgi:hypothetical protein